jgi:4-amino-4-deoxy-L-arabinose transferase-like glycosyltransferase
LRSLTLKAEIIQVDESDFAAQGQIWASGGMPYIDFVEKKPPLSYAFYAAVFAIAGWNMLAVHVFMLFWIALTAFGLHKIAGIIGFARAGPWAAVMYVMWSVCFPATATLPANTENMLVLPTVYAAYAYLRAIQNPRQSSFMWLIFAGACAAFASLFRHQGGIVLASFVFHLLFLAWRDGTVLRRFREILIIAIGFSLPWLVIAAFFYSKGATAELLEWNFANNMRYIDAGFEPIRFIGRLFSKTGLFMAANVVPVVLAFFAVRHRQKGTFWFSFLILWFLGAMVAVMVGGRFSAHYYVQLYPPLIMLAAIGFVSLIEEREYYTAKLKIMFYAMLFIPVVWSLVHWVSFYNRWFEPQSRAISEIAGHVRKHSGEDDKIFVWGYFSYPYYLSQRLPASRYVICEYIVPYWEKKLGSNKTFSASDLTDWHKRNYGFLLEDLQKNKPRIIVDMAGNEEFPYWNLFKLDFFPELSSLVKNSYKQITDVRGAIIYERIER